MVNKELKQSATTALIALAVSGLCFVAAKKGIPAWIRHDMDMIAEREFVPHLSQAMLKSQAWLDTPEAAMGMMPPSLRSCLEEQVFAQNLAGKANAAFDKPKALECVKDKEKSAFVAEYSTSYKIRRELPWHWMAFLWSIAGMCGGGALGAVFTVKTACHALARKP